MVPKPDTRPGRDPSARGWKASQTKLRAPVTRRTMLLIDDDDAFLGVMVPALDARSHRVLVARSGTEANLVVAKSDVDVIVVDGMLPDIDGIHWIEAFRDRDKV